MYNKQIPTGMFFSRVINLNYPIKYHLGTSKATLGDSRAVRESAKFDDKMLVNLQFHKLD